MDVDTDFRDSCVTLAPGYRSQCSPSDQPAAGSCSQTTCRKMSDVPVVPRWSGHFECRIAGCDSVEIDGPHLFPIHGRKSVNGDIHSERMTRFVYAHNTES